VAFLAAKALDLGDRQTRRAHISQRLADFLEFERLDDGGDLFHEGTPGLGEGQACRAQGLRTIHLI